MSEPNRRPPRIRLRRAATALCVTLCGLMCALWAASYFFWAYIHFTPSGTHELQIISVLGRINICYFDVTGRTRPWDSYLGRIDENARTVRRSMEIYEGPIGIGMHRAEWSVALAVPYWLVVGICGLLAALAQIKRFSFRALLVAMTLLAGLLGLAVYLL
jgi:hypothetical protein